MPTTPNWGSENSSCCATRRGRPELLNRSARGRRPGEQATRQESDWGRPERCACGFASCGQDSRGVLALAPGGATGLYFARLTGVRQAPPGRASRVPAVPVTIAWALPGLAPGRDGRRAGARRRCRWPSPRRGGGRRSLLGAPRRAASRTLSGSSTVVPALAGAARLLGAPGRSRFAAHPRAGGSPVGFWGVTGG